MNQGALTTTTTTTGPTFYGTAVLKPSLTVSNLGPTTISQYGVGNSIVGTSIFGNSVIGTLVVGTGYMPGSKIMGVGGGVEDFDTDVT